ncbi:MAG: collagen-like protein, partial [Gemmatimonadaceae bacterium]|nr:collagen-like protein [Gemmatimonadaceae bacterium]
GTNGVDGAAGTPGTNGVDGAAGTPGTNGVNGADGATGPAGPSIFSAITTATNTIATMTVGSGASLTTSGTGKIVATQMATGAIAYVTASIASATKTATATCGAGFIIVGGGVTGGDKGVSQSGPSGTNAWQASFLTNVTVAATVTAICMKTP